MNYASIMFTAFFVSLGSTILLEGSLMLKKYYMAVFCGIVSVLGTLCIVVYAVKFLTD